SLLSSTFLGGADEEYAWALAVDASGAAVVAGWTYSPDCPTTAGAYDTSFNGGLFDALVASLSPSGGSLLYSTFLGGTGYDVVSALALDGSGAATLAGSTSSADFPATAGAYDTSWEGAFDTFVSRLSPSGASLRYSTFLGGGFQDLAYALALDASGAATVAGVTGSSTFPTTAGAYDTGEAGIYDGFVTRLSPSGEDLLYSTFLGGTGEDGLVALALDATRAAAVAGNGQSSDFPTTPGAFDTGFNGGTLDAFVSRLDLLPAGASTYGASTSGCAGPLAIGVTSMPRVGNASFAITCGNGPASAFGFFGVSSAGLATPLVLGGLAVWIDPFAPLFFEIVVPSDAVGAALVPIPVPPNPSLAGAQFFFQFAWFDACASGGFSASNALAVTVQP
ncbi:MAG TPA: hypothetical protein VKF62_08995, partial [Planctomycetota bacterium]|nr:hypothetical protein [Planctomycetota bacterium]